MLFIGGDKVNAVEEITLEIGFFLDSSRAI